MGPKGEEKGEEVMKSVLEGVYAFMYTSRGSLEGAKPLLCGEYPTD